jgi:hypothetical protein
MLKPLHEHSLVTAVITYHHILTVRCITSALKIALNPAVGIANFIKVKTTEIKNFQ